MQAQVMQVIPVTKKSVVKVWQVPGTEAVVKFSVQVLDRDNIDVTLFPEQAAIVYDEPAPASARKVINELCKQYEIPRRRALYATALTELLSTAYANLEQVVVYRNNIGKPGESWQHKHRMNVKEMLTAVHKKEIDKYRPILESLDPIFLEQYDDYYEHVMGK